MWSKSLQKQEEKRQEYRNTVLQILHKVAPWPIMTHHDPSTIVPPTWPLHQVTDHRCLGNTPCLVREALQTVDVLGRLLGHADAQATDPTRHYLFHTDLEVAPLLRNMPGWFTWNGYFQKAYPPDPTPRLSQFWMIIMLDMINYKITTLSSLSIK